MKSLKYYLLCVSAAIAIFGCKKNDTGAPQIQSATDMLTAKPWKLFSYGFDTNKNGVVDSDEESIRDCESDNTYFFNKGGSGIVYENSKVCDGNDPLYQFTWSLKNNDAILDFIYASANIVKLSADSLVISDSNSDQVKLLLIYGH